MKSLYLIGSLRNSYIPGIAEHIQNATGVEVFASWFAAGERADDAWKEYCIKRGYSYEQALQEHAARHVFAFDKHHLDRTDGAILVLPAGRSGHLELGYVAGKGKYTAILLDDPDRWDVMYQFAGFVTSDIEALIANIAENSNL